MEKKMENLGPFKRIYRVIGAILKLFKCFPSGSMSINGTYIGPQSL